MWLELEMSLGEMGASGEHVLVHTSLAILPSELIQVTAAPQNSSRIERSVVSDIIWP